MIFNRNIAAPNKPVITFTIGSDTYTYTGEDIDEEGKFKIVGDGLRGWKMWIYTSMNFVFSFVNTTVDICAVGHGQAAGNYREISRGGGWVDIYYGAPGRGGQVLSELEYSGFNPGDVLEVVIEGNTTVTQKRNGTVVKSWLPTTGGGANGGGEVIKHFEPVDPAWAEGGGNGTDGSYAFTTPENPGGDPTFDGIKYGPGGCDGPIEDYGGYKPGQTYWAPGFGGIASVSGDQKVGGKGIVLMRYKEAT